MDSRWLANYTLLMPHSYVAGVAGGNDFQWCFSQVKGAIDEDVAEGKWSQQTIFDSRP